MSQIQVICNILTCIRANIHILIFLTSAFLLIYIN